MRNKNIILLLSLLILINGCKKKSDSSIIFDTYKTFGNLASDEKHKIYDTIKYKKNLTAFLVYDSLGQLRKIYTASLGYTFGHYFIFGKNGNLQKYYFLIDSATAKFEIINGTDKFNEIGSAFVACLPNQTQDTIKAYTLLFSTFPRRHLQVYISFDGINYDRFSVKQSQLMPFLQETNIRTNYKKIFVKTISTDLFFKLRNLSSNKSVCDTVIL